MMLKIAHLSYSDALGGAARAANRVHLALRAAKEVNSTMYVVNKVTDDVNVYAPKGKFEKLKSSLRLNLSTLVTQYAVPHDNVLRSLAVSGPGLIKKAQEDGCDVINLHWIGGETIDLSELRQVNVPIVWRVADMWPFCGAEHYAGDGDDERWKLGYDKTLSKPGVRLDVDKYVWLRKKQYIPSNLHLVATTSFVANCIKQSALFHNFNVSIIPNTLNTSIFNIWDKMTCREMLGLPKNKSIVLFGAMGGASDPRKGWDLLESALQKIAEQEGNDIVGVIFGQSEPQTAPDVGIPLIWMGHMSDDISLALLYSSADVMIVPSRQETFGQTASEAQACGCPVVAFNCTGLVDVVDHCNTGYLAQPYSSEDLANGILWVLSEKNRYEALRINARQRAERLWAFDVVAKQYSELYKSL